MDVHNTWYTRTYSVCDTAAVVVAISSDLRTSLNIYQYGIPVPTAVVSGSGSSSIMNRVHHDELVLLLTV